LLQGFHILRKIVSPKFNQWMRQNPQVCLQADEIGNRWKWISVVVTGTYLELNVPQYHTAQQEHAQESLAEKRRMPRADLK